MMVYSSPRDTTLSRHLLYIRTEFLKDHYLKECNYTLYLQDNFYLRNHCLFVDHKLDKGVRLASHPRFLRNPL